MEPLPRTRLNLDSPLMVPSSPRFEVAGWVACRSKIRSVALVHGSRRCALDLRPRSDVAKAQPDYRATAGFSGWADSSFVVDRALRFAVATDLGEEEHAVPLFGASPLPESIVQEHLRGDGVEIGAFKTPIPGIAPIYVDRFAEYAGEPTLADYAGDACSLPFLDSSLDYVASSHVIEHVANPLAALCEWVRVLRHGGKIFAVVPDRRLTFDHSRPLTPAGHMLADFRNRVGQNDPTHIDDFVYGVDWAQYSPQTAAADIARARDALAARYRSAVARGEEINIHFHTFELESFAELIALGNRAKIWPGYLALVDFRPAFPASNPNGFAVVAQISKTIRERIRSVWSPRGLRSDAIRFR